MREQSQMLEIVHSAPCSPSRNTLLLCEKSDCEEILKFQRSQVLLTAFLKQEHGAEVERKQQIAVTVRRGS